MKRAWWMLVLCAAAAVAQCPSGQSKDGNALVQIEQTWARALEQRDTAALACILTDEFEDAGPDGKLTDRATTLEKAAQHTVEQPAMHHELTELHAHVQGDFGYIRGLATAINAQGKVVVKVRFTDIYVYRDGRWQCVAGHESILTETSP